MNKQKLHKIHQINSSEEGKLYLKRITIMIV